MDNGTAQIIIRASLQINQFLGWQTEHTFNEITLVNIQAKYILNSNVHVPRKMNWIRFWIVEGKVTIKKVTDDWLAQPMITQNINYCDGFFFVVVNIIYLCFIRFTSLDPFESLKIIFSLFLHVFGHKSIIRNICTKVQNHVLPTIFSPPSLTFLCFNLFFFMRSKFWQLWWLFFSASLTHYSMSHKFNLISILLSNRSNVYVDNNNNQSADNKKQKINLISLYMKIQTEWMKNCFQKSV